MELSEIVSAHDPDQVQPAGTAAQIADGIYRITCSDDGFETADLDARISGDLARGLRALLEIAQRAGLLERIARRHQPPHPIEPQSLDRKQADGLMRQVRRIERAAEQADPHALGKRRQRLVDGG